MAGTMSVNPKDLEAIIQSKEWTPEQQVQELKRRMSLIFSLMAPPEDLPFTPRPSDVICAVPHKNGTTWLSHICHQIRMQGAEPDFKEQTDVVCFLEASKKMFGVEPENFVQPAEPRLFLSHLPYFRVPKGGKVIYLFRDQKDALFSMYRMFDSIAALKGRVSLAIFSQAIIKSGRIEETIKDLLILSLIHI